MTVCCALFFVFSGERAADPFAGYDRQTVSLSGSVVRKEIKRGAGEDMTVVWYLRPDDMQGVTVQVYAAAQPYAAGAGVPAIGMRVCVRGTLRCFREATNPGAFDERHHYRLLGVDCRLTNARVTEASGRADPYREGLFWLQRRLGVVIDACFDGTDAGMMKAMLLGDRSALDADLKKLYQRASLSHLYATSGLHCAAIGMALYALLKRMRLPACVSAVLCAALMISYGVLCGMPVSAARAVFMFSLRLFAPLFGRTFDLMSACSLVGILMLAEQPLYVRSAGFLLSFGAIAGIGVLLPALETLLPLPPAFREEADRFLRGRSVRLSVRIARGVYHALTSGCAVMLATLPVYMCFFYTVPVYSVLWNALAIPLTGILMTAGMAVIACGMLYVPLGMALSVICRVILWFYRVLCGGGIMLPGHTWYAGSAPVLRVAAYYLLLSVFVLRASGMRASVLRASALRGGGARVRASGMSDGGARVRASAFLRAWSLLRASAFLRARMLLWERLSFPRGSSRGQQRGFSRAKALRARGLCIVLLAVAVTALSVRHAPELQITVLDVGQGDGIVIRSGRYNYLIDCGSTSQSSVGEYCLIPYLKHEGIGYLDAVFVSHEDADHVNGIMELMDDMSRGGIRVGGLFLPDTGREEEIAELCARASANLPEAAYDGGDSPDAARAGHEASDDLPDAAHAGYGASADLPDAARTGYGASADLPDAARTGYETSEDLYLALALQAHRLGIPVTFLRAGQQVSQENLVFTCLAPLREGAAFAAENANAHSLVLHMRYAPAELSTEGNSHAAKQTAERNGHAAEQSAQGNGHAAEQSAQGNGHATEQSAQGYGHAAEHSADRGPQPGFSALFTGDVEAEGLTELNRTIASLPEAMRNVDLLKVAHHGSRHTTDETFLSLVDARLAVISCGRNNRYGHPHAELLDRLAADGMRIMTTAESGAITVRMATDGSSCTVEPYLRQE